MIAIYYGDIRDPDTQNYPMMYFKANGAIWVFHKNRLIDPQNVWLAIFMAIIIIRILENPPWM